MGSLRDETYENLDYLSQLTEVVLSPQNDLLIELPERIELNFDQIIKFKQPSWKTYQGFEITKSSIFMSTLEKEKWHLIKDIEAFFDFQVSEDFELDLINNTMTGTIALVKKVNRLDEKKLLQIAVENTIYSMERYNWDAKRIRERTITILNTLEAGRGTEWAKKLEGRVSYQAYEAINSTLREVILENKWRVRDAKIISKMGEWIGSYMSDRNDVSVGLVNLIKLKIMLDKDLPVYSMDEVKNVNPI